jgi:hypothetical protein
MGRIKIRGVAVTPAALQHPLHKLDLPGLLRDDVFVVVKDLFIVIHWNFSLLSAACA